MELGAFTPAQGVISVLEAVLKYGDKVSPRGMNTAEIRHLSLDIAEPWAIPFELEHRNLNHRISAIEIASLIGQMPTDALVEDMELPLRNYFDDGIAYGNYGIRIRNQLQRAVYLLDRDPDTRQAVISIYDGPRDLDYRTRDVPCTVALQFFIRHNMLEMRTVMRSNDAWLGLPYDLMQFCALQCAVAQLLDREPGHYVHAVGSMHLYEEHFHKATLVATTKYSRNNGYCNWSAKTLTELVQNAQRFISGRSLLQECTKFERWLHAQIHGLEISEW